MYSCNGNPQQYTVISGGQLLNHPSVPSGVYKASRQPMRYIEENPDRESKLITAYEYDITNSIFCIRAHHLVGVCLLLITWRQNRHCAINNYHAGLISTGMLYEYEQATLILQAYCQLFSEYTRVPFYWNGFTLFPAWINNHIPGKVLDWFTYPFSYFNRSTLEVWEWINNFIPQIIMDAIVYPWWDNTVKPCQ